jgi:single-strand DNA-binding protein
MQGLNELFLIGRLVRDPEVKTTQAGKIVTQATIAVDRPKSKEADKAIADFIQVTAWEKRGEFFGNLSCKGTLVFVKARVQPRQYDDKDGTKKYTTDFVVQDFKILAGGVPRGHAPSSDPADPSQFGHDVAPDDDTIPF